MLKIGEVTFSTSNNKYYLTVHGIAFVMKKHSQLRKSLKWHLPPKRNTDLRISN